jgi:hypothetical protein
MAIQGTNGTGNQFSDRFASGDVISASQLNDLINGISTALPQPYLGAGPNISFGSGGTVITTSETDAPNEINFSLSLAFGGEKVNHWEIAVIGFDAGSGTLGFAMKVAKGGNIWRPAGSACDNELRADVITTDGTLTVVPGTDIASPWASTDGHIVIAPESIYYVYAYKVEKDTGEASFYIYVSQDGTLADFCPVTLPTGITPPSGTYEVQVLLVGSVAWVTYTTPPSFVVDQQIIGSITWPNAGGVSVAPPEQFEVRVEPVDDTYVIKIARGRVIAGIGQLPPNAEYNTVDVRNKSYEIRNVAVYPEGSSVTGADYASVWSNNDGHIVIPEGATAIGVYVMRNQNKQFPAYNNLVAGWPYLAVMVHGSDADVKTRPWHMGQGDGQNWWTMWVHGPMIEVDTGLDRFYGEDANDISYGAPSFRVKLQNYNCQRFKIADLTLDGETGVWSVNQYLIGSLTLPHNYCYSGVYRVQYSSTQTGYPIWWTTPDYSSNQENWEKDYTGSTKWDGSLPEPTREVDPI